MAGDITPHISLRTEDWLEPRTPKRVPDRCGSWHAVRWVHALGHPGALGAAAREVEVANRGAE